MSTLSLCMIVKNEEINLPYCLSSVKGIADEIIIVDTGSTDNTIEVAEKYGAKIYLFEWIDDFSAARNFALSKCTCEMILYLDADEYIADDSQKDLIDAKKCGVGTGIFCVVKSVDDYSGRENKVKYIRLFSRGDGISFRGKAHEQIQPSLIENGYKLIDSSIQIIHTGYNISLSDKKLKAKRNLELLLSDYNNEPSAYCAFQLGNTYLILENKSKAVDYFEEALRLKGLSKQQKSLAYEVSASFALEKNDLKSAADIVAIGLKENPSSSTLWYLSSKIYLRTGETKKAAEACVNSWRKNNAAGKNTFDDIIVKIDEEELCLYGISLSVISKDSKGISFYLKELRKHYDAVDKESSDAKAEILTAVLENRDLNRRSVGHFAQLMTRSNHEILLNIIDGYKKSDGKLRLLSTVFDEFKSSPKYLSSYGVALYENRLFEEAYTIFEELRERGEGNPAVIFYLISLSVQLSRYENIPALIAQLEKGFSDIPEVYARLITLKEKLGPLIK